MTGGAPDTDRAPFRTGLVIGLVIAGLASFAAFIALLGWGGEAEAPGAGKGFAASPSAVGFRGLVELTGSFAETGTARSDADLRGRGLLVVALDPADDPAALGRLLDQRRTRPTLVILPKWVTIPDPARQQWVRALGPGQLGDANRLVGPGYRIERQGSGFVEREVRAEGSGVLDGLSFPFPRDAQVIVGPDTDPLIAVADGGLVSRVRGGPLFVAADPDLLNNQALKNPDSARAAVQMVLRFARIGDGGVTFALGLTALEGAHSLIRTMFEPPFLAMTLALLVAALLAAMHGVARFGAARRPERAIPFGKAALVENSAGLVRLAGREVTVGMAYADLVRDDAARAGAAPSNLQGEALEHYLDRFTRPEAEPFSALAWDVRAAGSRADLLTAGRKLFQWKKDMIR